MHNLVINNLKPLDIHYLHLFPCYFCLKDKKGKFISANNYFAQEVGFDDYEELIGLSDEDLWKDDAKLIQQNDYKVLSTLNEGFVFIESATFPNGKRVRVISHKVPLRDKRNKKIGLAALSIILDRDMSSYLNQLTQRQLSCLRHLAQGMTMKQIAKNLQLSPKTVEHYIETVKIKLQLNTRIELIKFALQLGL